MTEKNFGKTFNKAISDKSTLFIKYTDSKGKITGRVVEPYQLDLADKASVFWGYDMRYKGIRKFYVDRISDAIITNSTFEPRWPIDEVEIPNK